MAADSSPEHVHVLFLKQTNEDVSGRLEDAYKGHTYRLSPTVFLLRSSDSTAEIATKLGLRKEQLKVPGAVFRLNGTYSGYFKTDLWDWLG